VGQGATDIFWRFTELGTILDLSNNKQATSDSGQTRYETAEGSTGEIEAERNLEEQLRIF
jgi:hypothetical protein